MGCSDSTGEFRGLLMSPGGERSAVVSAGGGDSESEASVEAEPVAGTSSATLDVCSEVGCSKLRGASGDGPVVIYGFLDLAGRIEVVLT
jgi:hypothetical protein